MAILRISGSDAFEIAARHVRPWPRAARVATLCEVHEGGIALDDALVTIFEAPHSFTGEAVVEISSHGGVAVPAAIMSALLRSGAREADPGEFTRRAVLNGKLDLVQAEAIGELVNATTSATRKASLTQLHGGLSRKLAELRESFLSLEALIAYDIDFPEEDDGPVDETAIRTAVGSLERELEVLASTARIGEVIRAGATVVIAGPPNSGKSSLFNALIGKERAIVTEIPGTTRDALEAVIEAAGWPLRLVDTAGLRATDDRLEKLGIEASERYLVGADAILACGDTNQALAATAAAIATLTPSPILSVRTKADVASSEEMKELDDTAVAVSAEKLTGLDRLTAVIADVLAQTFGSHADDALLLTTARQANAVNTALAELRAFAAAREQDEIPATVAAVHLRAAASALEELMGAVTVDDILDRLFSTFCVGK